MIRIALALLALAPAQAFAAYYFTRPGTVFYTAPNGEVMDVGSHRLIQTPPLERKDEWCFFKLANGRGAPVNPPAAWTKCSNLDINGFAGV